MAPKVHKLSISLRDDVYQRVLQVVDATGLDRSSAISLLLASVHMEEVLPRDYVKKHGISVPGQGPGKEETPE